MPGIGWITTGPRVQMFEKALQDYFGHEHAFAVSSATAGLHIALLAMDLKPGDEVITTTMTLISTVNTIVHAGENRFWWILIPTPTIWIWTKWNGPSRQNPCHFTGALCRRPSGSDRLYGLAEKHNLTIFEDAHAIGAQYKGKKIGSFGHTQVFSFHPNKNMTTGEGGCVVTRDPETFQRMKRLRFHGINKDAFNRYAKEGSPFFDVLEPGFKFNMMDIQAALGIHQIQKLEGFIDRRNALVQRYQNAFKDWEQLTCPVVPEYDHKHAISLYSPSQFGGKPGDTG